MNNQQAGNERRKKQAQAVWQKRQAEIEWLYNTQQWPQQKVAEYFKVTLAAIQKVMKRLGIKTRTRANNGTNAGPGVPVRSLPSATRADTPMPLVIKPKRKLVTR